MWNEYHPCEMRTPQMWKDITHNKNVSYVKENDHTQKERHT